MKLCHKIVWLIALTALTLTGAACRRAAPPAASGGATISMEEFARLAENASGVVLVDFWATWCGPCRKMKPLFEQAERDYAGRIGFVAVDVDQNAQLANKYRVEAIPTYIVFKDGKVQETRVGAMEASDFKAWLDSLIQ